MRRRAAGRVLVVWLAAGAWAAASAAPQEPKADPAVEAARLGARNAALETLVALAGGKEFYLVLDPAKPDLTLMLRGAQLRRFPVQGMSVGVPRVGWLRRHEPRPWQGVVWEHGRLDPPREIDRVEITPPQPEGSDVPPGATEAPAAPVIPPTPEEAYPVPPRFQIFFDLGPAIEVRPREADLSAGLWSRLAAWWHARWRDTVAALKSTPDDLVRLRVVLAPEDADSLYRSLPPDTKLLVLDNRPAGGEAPR